VGFVVDKVALGKVSSENFSFLLVILIASVLYTQLSVGSGTIGPLEAAVARDSASPQSSPKKGKVV
jgi:hypothetical protein